MHPIYLNVEKQERQVGWLEHWAVTPEIEKQVVLSMAAPKLLEIAIDLAAVPEVREVLQVAKEEGCDVGRALALFGDQPAFPEENLPW